MTEAIDTSSPYTNAFLTERPKAGIDIIQFRVNAAIKLNQELADYFAERAHAEGQYADSLAKLAKKRFIGDEAVLGHMLPVWNMLYAEITQVSSIHADLASQMEEISAPLRSSVEDHAKYKQLRSMEADFQRLARDYEELYAKTAKHKKKQPSGPKFTDYRKNLEEKSEEWQRFGPEFIKMHQAVDEYRWANIKGSVERFEAIQERQLKKRVELAGHILGATSGFSVEEEIMAFCAGHSLAAPLPPLSPVSPSIPSTDEPALHLSSSTSTPVSTLPSSSSDISMKKKSAIKRLLSRPSVRRKPKNENGYVNADFGLSHNRSSIEDSTLNSTDLQEQVYSPKTESSEVSPSAASPTSLSPPSLRKAPSFSGSFMSGLSQTPKVVVDAEGYSIPPPDRNTIWNDTASVEDFNSEGSSMAGGSRLKVDITKNVVEDDPNAHIVLSRVATLLKEKKAATINGNTGRRGRRRLQQVPEQSTDASFSILTDPFKESTPTIMHAFSEDKPEQSGGAAPLINVVMTETVRVSMKNGKQEIADVSGQVEITYRGSPSNAGIVCFQIANMNDVQLRGDCILPLRGNPGVYQLDVQKLQSLGDTVAVGMGYRAKTNVPAFLQVKPRWKCVCDQKQSLLLVKYKNSSADKTLDNVRFTTPTGDSLDMQSLPMGVLHAEKNECEWTFDTIADSKERELRAKFGMKQLESSQTMLAQFAVAGQLATTASINRGSLENVLWAELDISHRSCNYIVHVVGDVLHTES